MKQLGFWECLVLVSFWVAGLTGFFVGGLTMVGHVVQVFLVVGFGWVAYQLYKEYAESWKVEHYRNQVFADWAKRNNRLKGIDQ